MNDDTEEKAPNVSLKDEIEKLLQLQDRDVKLNNLFADKEAHPQRLAGLRDSFQHMGQDLEAAKEHLKQFMAEIKKIELDVQSKQQNILKHSNQLFQVKTNEEYRALEKEIETEKLENSRKEDEILEKLMEVDEIKKKIDDLEKDYAAQQQNLKEQEILIEERLKNIEIEIKQTQDERHNLEVRIREDVLSRYNQVMKNKPDVAVVPVDNYTCMGCHMALIHQSFADVKRGTELVSCENCSRILYLPEV